MPTPYNQLSTTANVLTDADLRYSIVIKIPVNDEVLLEDRAVNAVSLSSAVTTLTVNFPSAVAGGVRDFFLRLTVAAGVTAPELSFPVGVTLENADGAVPEIADGGTGAAATTTLYFTETAAGVFLVKGETVTTIAVQ